MLHATVHLNVKNTTSSQLAFVTVIKKHILKGQITQIPDVDSNST
jgi:hypothetical protein